MSEATREALAALESGLSILREFDAQSEGRFLQLGESLHGVARVARRLAECAGELAGEDGVGRYREAVAEFESLMDELRGIRGGAERRREVLGRIAALARAFRGPAREFSRANRTFRLLGLYVRVESSRLKAEGAEFGSLADDITTLAAGIDESAARLEQDSGQAGAAIEGGRKRIGELDRQQAAESGEMLELASHEIGELSRRAAEAEAAARALAEGCRRLRDEISRMVQSLQFQDIARQRLEHVCEGLERLAHGLRQGAASGCARLAALEARQFESARQELEAALGRIATSLTTAAGQAERFQAEAGRLSAEDGGLSACAESMTATARECTASLTQLGQVVAEVMPVLEEMAGSAARIDETGYRIGLVSLNCAVKTARLGAEGAALGVVAAELGRLAMVTGGEAEAASARLEDLRRETAVLVELGAAGSGSGLAGRVTAALARATGAERAGRERLEAVRTWSERLQGELRRHTEQDDWAERLLARLSEAGERLKDLEQVLRRQEGWQGEVSEEWSQGLEVRYTMASEREIHQEYMVGHPSQEAATLANQNATNDDGIELF